MRARNIKPGFWANEKLGALHPLARLTFIGLWCLADCDGILENRPERIRAQLFPYEKSPDLNGYLTVLEQNGFILRYKSGIDTYIQIVNFKKHQSPHHTEKPKNYPKPQASDRPMISDGCAVTVTSPCHNALNPESGILIPDSLNPESTTAGKPARTEVYPVEFENFWKAYPKRSGDNPKSRALKAWNARRREGIDPARMIEGAIRYAAYVRATGKEHTEYVKQAATFLGPDRSFDCEFNPPEPQNDIAAQLGIRRDPPNTITIYPIKDVSK